MVLEETTRRIENGEFDIQIDAKGSNEITSLTASLNRMRNSLKQEENRRMLFLMGVTHDLKTPLALIKANVEAIEDGISSNPEEKYKSLGIINSKVDDMEGQINNLLDFVRIGDMQWKHNKEKVVLSTFMDDYAERTAMDAELLHRKVEKHIELKNTLVINMDKALVSRALDNIVNNSLQHCPPGGIITIGATLESVKQRDANRIVISIADNGPGIRESDLPHVFEIFYRGSLSRRENGQGLGLAVVKAIIDAHGWEIEALSSPGSGAVFRILIDSEEYIP
jgi:signal transduction histidine kinase